VELFLKKVQTNIQSHTHTQNHFIKIFTIDADLMFGFWSDNEEDEIVDRVMDFREAEVSVSESDNPNDNKTSVSKTQIITEYLIKWKVRHIHTCLSVSSRSFICLFSHFISWNTQTLECCFRWCRVSLIFTILGKLWNRFLDVKDSKKFSTMRKIFDDIKSGERFFTLISSVHILLVLVLFIHLFHWGLYFGVSFVNVMFDWCCLERKSRRNRTSGYRTWKTSTTSWRISSCGSCHCNEVRLNIPQLFTLTVTNDIGN
jgi:hypothetical protein